MGCKLQTKHEIYIIKVFSHEKTSLFGIFTYFYLNGVYHRFVVLCTVRHKVIYIYKRSYLILGCHSSAPTELMRKVLCGTASCQNRQRPFSEQ